MTTSFSYSFGFVVLMIASMLVVAQNSDPCEGINKCETCVTTVANLTTNATCIYRYTTATPLECVANDEHGEGDNSYRTVDDCKKLPNTTTTTPAPTTPTTTVPTTTTSTTTPTPTTPPPTNATTTTPASTTTVTTTTTAAPNATTTTAAPTGPTTAPPSTTAPPTAAPAPRGGGGMSVASFFGGIVFTLCVSAVGYLVWRFYKARLDRNYHTLSTNLI